MAQTFLIGGVVRPQITVAFHGTVQNNGPVIVSVIPKLSIFVAGVLQNVVGSGARELPPGSGTSSVSLSGLLDTAVSSFPVGEVTAEATLTEVSTGTVIKTIASGPTGVTVRDFPSIGMCARFNAATVAAGYTSELFTLTGGPAFNPEAGENQWTIAYADGQPHVFWTDPTDPTRNTGLSLLIGGAVNESTLVHC